ncbi:hypothetical protein GWK47_002878 [Chionoecetes opilio]|uniref:Uncharacterized protein n=1 Tax=Chionoecetes opilio TaxID=41210 RepID=A0A8J5CC26_CHIOP|nr:hypothetical protein GWK47_002878 [Chionoecetes opilio]
MTSVPEVILLNKGEPTHIAGGVLDLSFVSQDLNRDATWELHPHLASDHFASCTRLQTRKRTRPPPPPKWNLNQANWYTFEHSIANILASTPTPDSLEEADYRLTAAFHEAANIAIPLTKPGLVLHKDRWYYNAEVREYNRKINQARKLYRRHNTEETRTLLRAAIRLAREATRKIKTQKWLKWCSSINHSSNLSAMWKKIHMISGKASVRQAVHPNPADEANRLVQSFAARSSTALYAQAVQDTQRRLFPARIAAVSRSCSKAALTEVPFHHQRTARYLQDTQGHGGRC